MDKPNWRVAYPRPRHKEVLGADLENTRNANNSLALKTIAEALVAIVNMMEEDRRG